uniref:Uncharacterized protein n=1 Tax=Nothoprocta perdicaria TaxID=30464 RepID=A0A8C6ZLA5_NOTPE
MESQSRGKRHWEDLGVERPSKGSACAQLSCECDRSLALCLRRHRGSYRAALRLYPRAACRP